MRPTTRRVTAQRKFAQGAPVPPVVATVSTSNTSNSERRELPPPAVDKSTNVFHNNMTAKSLLDVVCFQGSHCHLQPVVLVERLQERRMHDDKEPSTSSQAPRFRPRAGRPVRDKRTPLKHSMNLRNRERAQKVQKPPSKLLPKPGPKKKVTRGRKRKPPEFTLDDNRPLTYFAKCSTPNEAISQNTERIFEQSSMLVLECVPSNEVLVTPAQSNAAPTPVPPTPPPVPTTVLHSDVLVTPSVSTEARHVISIASESPASYYSEQGIHRWIDGYSIPDDSGPSRPPQLHTIDSSSDMGESCIESDIISLEIRCISRKWRTVDDAAKATKAELDLRCSECDHCAKISKVILLTTLLKRQRTIDCLQDDSERRVANGSSSIMEDIRIELLPKHPHLQIKITSITVKGEKKYAACLIPRSEVIVLGKNFAFNNENDAIIQQIIDNLCLDLDMPMSVERIDSPPLSVKNSPFLEQDDGTILEAPVFSLSTDQYERFQHNPLLFIEKIWDQVARCGICKIVPPENFVPTCKADDETRFEVSNQYISRLYNRWGPSAREMCAIKACLKAQNIAFQRPPLLEGLEVNLPKLYHIVQRHGGLEKVINKKKWGKVAEEMKLKRNPMIEKKLDAIYFRYLLPYDTLSSEERQGFSRRVEKAWTIKNQKLLDRANNPLHRQKRLLGESDSSSDEIEDDETADAEDCVKPGAHMNLAKFKKIARTAFDNLFRNQAVNAKFIEDEYWHQVTMGSEHVCVNTASIDTREQGLGFPDIKRGNEDPWNLKAISNHPDNVLRSLGPAVGVTIPTLHLGMVFSSSCWHRDPHSIPWMEFLHHGTVKIWYGVPEWQDMNFRNAAQTLNPTACQNKSLWLSSDIAMIPPTLLRDHGVKVFRVEQIPGEYVLVMPRAYSCSISTDFTISESAYFATERWLETLTSVFREIRDSCEPTMFALEQLLKCLVEDPNVKLKILLQIRPLVELIFNEEISNREKLLSRGIKFTENVQTNSGSRSNSKGKRKQTERPPSPPVWNIREQEECEVCRCTLYLSKVKHIPMRDSLVCLSHALQLMGKKKYENIKFEDLEMVVNFSLEQVQKTILTLQQRIFGYAIL